MRLRAESDRAGASREFSMEAFHLPMPRNPRATLFKARSHTKLTAHLATAGAVAEDQKAAPSPMILFSRWSAIKGCARLSSLAALNWGPQTGAETCLTNP